MYLHPQLAQIGYEFACEIREGKWDHLANPNLKLVDAYPRLIPELQNRCPGFLKEEYANAIAEGLKNSR
jgi:hypothetical protein